MADSVLAKMAVEISAKAAGFKSGLDDANNHLAGFAKQAKFVANSIKTFFAANIIGGIGKEIFNTTSEFQKMGAVLTNALGSRSQAQASLRDITEFSAKTPFQVSELTQSYVKLVNQGFKPTLNQLRQLGDLAASTGKSFDQLTEAIIDAQTGEFERLKEFGIRAQKEGDKVRFTFKGVETQVDFTGKSIREYISSLGDLQGVSGSMAAISATLEGKFSNLQDNVGRLLTFIGDSSSGLIGGLLDLANDGLGALNDALDDQVGALQKEQSELNVLVGAITDVNVPTEVRKKLIQDLNQKYPDFLKNLNIEKVTNEQLVSRLADVNKQFERKILLVAAEKQLAKLSEDIIETVDDEAEARIRLKEATIAANNATVNNTAGATAIITKLASDRIKAEGEIARAQERRAELQKGLNERTKAYNEALSLFDSTNNDYFTGTTKSTVATQQFSDALDKIRFKLSELKDTGNVNFAGEFVDTDAAFRESIDATTDSLIKQTEAALGLGAALEYVNINEEDAAKTQQEAQEARQKTIDQLLGITAAVENFGQSLVQGQETFVQALGNLTLDIIDLYLKQALAAAIAKSVQSGGPLPVALAAAAVSVGVIRSLFSKSVGKSSGGGGGGGSAGSVASSRSATNSNQQNFTVTVEGRLSGQDILLSSKKAEKSNKFTKG